LLAVANDCHGFFAQLPTGGKCASEGAPQRYQRQGKQPGEADGEAGVVFGVAQPKGYTSEAEKDHTGGHNEAAQFNARGKTSGRIEAAQGIDTQADQDDRQNLVIEFETPGIAEKEAKGDREEESERETNKIGK